MWRMEKYCNADLDLRHLGHVAAIWDALRPENLRVPPAPGVPRITTSTLHLARQLGCSGNVRDKNLFGIATDCKRLQGLTSWNF